MKPTLGWLTVAEAWRDYRQRWRPLLVIGLACRTVAFLVLGPLYALIVRVAIAGSGKSVLTDQDLLYFVSSPLGLVGLLIVVSGALGIAALELGAMLTVLAQPEGAEGLSASLAFTGRHAGRIFRLTLRWVLVALLWLAPAVALAAATYYGLLTRYDINYYLTERPPAFIGSVAIAIVLGAFGLYALLRLATEAAIALPIALFEQQGPRAALSESRQRTAGSRAKLVAGILLWAGGSTLLGTIAGLLSALFGWLFAPAWPTSLVAVAIGVGAGLIAMIVIGVLLNLLATHALAALIYRAYRQLSGADTPLPTSPPSSARTSWLVTRTRLVACLALTPLVATTVGFVALGRIPLDDAVLVIGHRGSPRSAPGNTLVSIETAIAEGADWVEIDVQESADNQVIVFHDSDFMKAAGSALKVWEATRTDLDAIDLARGSSRGPQRVPTLEEVLEVCRDRVGVVIELKYYGHDIDLERRVALLVESASMTEQTMFMSLNHEGVAKLKSLRPRWRTGQLLSVAVGSRGKLEADFLAVNAAYATRGRIREAHREGRDLYVWTVNDPRTMSSLISRGVDGLITDVPGTARAVLEARAQMTPVARLLVDLADRFRLASPFAPELSVEAP